MSWNSLSGRLTSGDGDTLKLELSAMGELERLDPEGGSGRGGRDGSILGEMNRGDGMCVCTGLPDRNEMRLSEPRSTPGIEVRREGAWWYWKYVPELRPLPVIELGSESGGWWHGGGAVGAAATSSSSSSSLSLLSWCTASSTW